MLIPRSLISFVQQCANVFKSFRLLETDCNIQRDFIECSESNMSNCIIEFGIPEL